MEDLSANDIHHILVAILNQTTNVKIALAYDKDHRVIDRMKAQIASLKRSYKVLDKIKRDLIDKEKIATLDTCKKERK